MTNTTDKKQIEELIRNANAAQSRAYAPYSNYSVGCALLAEGEIFIGANIENASYGLTTCAERNATAAAVLAGKRKISAVVITTQSSPPAPPCGMCLQTLQEFADSSVDIVLVNPSGERSNLTLQQLLPYGFGLNESDKNQ